MSPEGLKSICHTSHFSCCLFLTALQVLGDVANNAGFEEAVLVDEGILMEGFGPPPGATYCMFPDEQDLVMQEWDLGGAVLDFSALRQEEGE